MVNIDRKKAPNLGVINKLEFPPIERTTLLNGIAISKIEGCSQPVCNINIVIKRGAYLAKEVFIASATANLLCEGTKNYPGHKFAELLDFYGIITNSTVTLFETRISLRTLSKHINVAIMVLGEMILNPEFSTENFKLEMEQSKEGLKIANERVNYLAQKEFLQLLFGREHKYGRLNSIESLKNVKLSDIKGFHKEHYTASNFAIYLAGNVPENAVTLLNKTFGDLPIINSKEIAYEPVKDVTQHYSYIKKKDAKQSAIFIGKTLVPYSHEDFPAIYFLNVVLGGYFGSRLMTKLREEMGITYGINSYIIPRKESSELYISTEVKSEATEDGKEAIFQVISDLQEIEVGQDEIMNVRNYILGNLANLFDSSFSVTNQLLTLEYANSNLDNFNKIIEMTRTITPKMLKETAIKYLDKSQFVCAIAGS